MANAGAAYAGLSKAVPRERPFGPYRLLAKLEHTGLYESFLARPAKAPQTLQLVRRLHHHLERQPGYVEMFREQARIAARVVHPNVVRVLDQGEIERRHFVAYEWLHGQPLARAVKRLCGENRGMPLPLALHVVDRILEALEYAHTLPPDEDGTIVHGEVSPGNVVLTYDGRVVLLGFGAIRPNDPRLKPELTAVHGGYGYASPEQAKGTDVDRRSDVWSAGVLLWELVAGRHLFTASSEMAIMRQLLHGELPVLEDVVPVPKPLARAVGSALCRDRDLRPPAARVLMDRLAAAEPARADAEELAAKVRELFVAEEAKDRMLLEELTGLSVERLIEFTSDPPPPSSHEVERRRSRALALGFAMAVALGLACALALGAS
jgi:serine/threonine-protein kinase